MQIPKWEPPEPPETFFRPLGVGSHTEGARQNASVTQKLPASSAGSEGHHASQKSKAPHLKWGPWNLKLASRVFLSGNKDSHHLR